ncbi:MAG: hypothetical protein JNM56_14010 [Planctomycetia bacterium]|nr:hypothetical protein [Planctomycetia bacterium]
MTSPAFDLPDRMQRLEQQIEDLQRSAGAELQADVQQMVRTILDFHAASLTRLLALVAESGVAGRGVLERCAHDELVGNLLLLHGLHPWDLTARVRFALAGIRPQLQAQDMQVHLLSANEAAVVLRLLADDRRGALDRSQLQAVIVETVAAAVPEVSRIEFEEDAVRPLMFPLPLIDAKTRERS